MPLVPAWLGLAHEMLKRYAGALPLPQECISRAPNLSGGHLRAAATSTRLGRRQEARAEVVDVPRIQPSYTIGGTKKRWGASSNPYRQGTRAKGHSPGDPGN